TEAGFKAGHAQGYDSGQMAGHQAGQALATQETDRIQNLAHSCSQAIETLHGDIGQALISLSIKIAEQVLRSTLQSHPDKILDVVHDIMQIDQGKDALLKLRLNPEDQLLVERYLDQEG